MAARFERAAQPESSDQQPQLRVGRLTKAHGLKGAIKLELYTDDPERRFVPGAEFTLQVPEESPWFGKKIQLRELRWYNSHPVGFFEGVDDRTAAEVLAKAILWIDQDLEETTGDSNAWYDHQLAGLDVRRDGESVGSVVRIEHMPAQDLLIVKTREGEIMVPFVSAIVPTVDIEAGFIVVTPPKGLFETNEAEIAAPSEAEKSAESDAATDAASETNSSTESDSTESGSE